MSRMMKMALSEAFFEWMFDAIVSQVVVSW